VTDTRLQGFLKVIRLGGCDNSVVENRIHPDVITRVLLAADPSATTHRAFGVPAFEVPHENETFDRGSGKNSQASMIGAVGAAEAEPANFVPRVTRKARAKNTTRSR